MLILESPPEQQMPYNQRGRYFLDTEGKLCQIAGGSEGPWCSMDVASTCRNFLGQGISNPSECSARSTRGGAYRFAKEELAKVLNFPSLTLHCFSLSNKYKFKGMYFWFSRIGMVNWHCYSPWLNLGSGTWWLEGNTTCAWCWKPLVLISEYSNYYIRIPKPSGWQYFPLIHCVPVGPFWSGLY